LGSVESSAPAIVVYTIEATLRIRHAVADLCGKPRARNGWTIPDPVHRIDLERLRMEAWIVMALHDG
jgi:hypothetical protein